MSGQGRRKMGRPRESFALAYFYLPCFRLVYKCTLRAQEHCWRLCKTRGCKVRGPQTCIASGCVFRHV